MIENKIKEFVWKKISKKLIFKPQIIDDHAFSFLFKVKFPIVRNGNENPDFNFPIYDNDGNKSFGCFLDKDSVIDFKVELKEVWIGTKEFGCNWEIKEVRIISSDANTIKTSLFPEKKNEDNVPKWIIDLLMAKVSAPPKEIETKVIEKKVYTPAPFVTHPEPQSRPTSLSYQGGKTAKCENEPKSMRKAFVPNLNDIKNAKNKLRKTTQEK